MAAAAPFAPTEAAEPSFFLPAAPEPPVTPVPVEDARVRLLDRLECRLLTKWWSRNAFVEKAR